MLASKAAGFCRQGTAALYAADLSALGSLQLGGVRNIDSLVTDLGPSELTGPSLLNKGLKRGPGGRSSISGITATVFGSTGFLGRYVVNALARQGTQCVLPLRADELDFQHLKPMGDLGQIVILNDFDVFNDSELEKAVSRSNLVINLLGSDKETMNFTFDDIHVEAAKKVATAAASNGLLERYMHVSHIAASPDHPSRRLKSKYEGEQITKEIIPDATIFKTAQMTGVEDRLLNNLAGLAKLLPFVPLVDGGHSKLQPVYVRDVADAMIGSLNSKDTAGKTYHLAGPEVMTFQELTALTFETLREEYRAVPIPSGIARLLTKPREILRPYAQIPMNTFFTEDFINELERDAVVPSGPQVLTFKELGVSPRKISQGIPIEHIRHLRAGGYDMGTTGDQASTGGAGFR